ncbi:outer membrane beta-barrel family protein [Aureibacter tunicatorum]|uniref:Outer membrane protein beta-barrel domain-containing protein n=1 Tax=Aureibacter tunicatorum TaxID=866807 RepID=A0AAE3XI48_9BACT|nr:outer membrane beta-barrel family protein [Aureibacter tunicatorum]MDR6237227.1 hypothetical protein [Aureibacter tunicatorum]BDD06219.1 TonB-dependent receptor [Aureibacter tunicatorum]
MKFLIYFSFILMLPLQVVSQNTIKGKILSDENTPVEFANVVILHSKDSSLFKGAITDLNGEFEFKFNENANYILQASAVGFESWSRKIECSNGCSTTINEIILTQGKLLEEIAVTAKRPMVERKIDRIVFNVENTLLTSGGNALEVLKKTPAVWIDQEGNVQINGKGGVLIMINGKRSYMSGQDLKNMLEGMDANEILSIEVITNPSSKYDAEGIAGILDIKLKKQLADGYSGSISGEYTQSHKAAYRFNGELKAKIKKLNFKMSATQGDWVGFNNTPQVRETSQSYVEQHFHSDNYNNFQNLNLESDYAINDKHNIAAVYRFNKFEGNSKSDNLHKYSITGEQQFIITDDNYFNFNNRFHSGSLNYTFDIDTLGRKLEFLSDYFNRKSKSKRFFKNTIDNSQSGQSTTQESRNFQDDDAETMSAQIDYTHPFSSSTKLELGAKASFTNLQNIVAVDSLREDNWENQKQLSYTYDHEETITSAYFNLSHEWEKISIQGGLRAERTTLQGTWVDADSVFNRSYTKLFPSLFINHKISKDHNLSYSYSYRLNRPWYGFLNPARVYYSILEGREGNPNIQPEYSHVGEIGYTFKGKYNMSINYTNTEGGIQNFPILDNDISIYKPFNMMNYHEVALALSLPITITKWWETMNSFNYSSNWFIDIPEEISQIETKGYSGYFQSVSTLTLPKDIRAELSWYWDMRYQSSFESRLPFHYLDVSAEKDFFKEKLTLKLSMRDVFNTLKIETDEYGVDQHLTYTNSWNSQRFSASLRYNFSKGEKVDIKHKKSSNTEKNRL